MLRRECLLWRQRRAPVPGAHILADVAAKYMPTDAGTVLLGNRAAQLDRKVRDAQPRIQFVATGADGMRGTSIDATGARAAAIRGGRVRFKRKRRKQLSQEEPRPQRLVDQAGVL